LAASIARTCSRGLRSWVCRSRSTSPSVSKPSAAPPTGWALRKTAPEFVGPFRNILLEFRIVKISQKDVLHVAELAHLELTEAEVETYRRQLDSILSYVEKLNELDTSQVEPMSQVLTEGSPEENPALRDDTPQPCTVGPEVLAQAPEPTPPYFRVPKVIERCGLVGDDLRGYMDRRGGALGSRGEEALRPGVDRGVLHPHRAAKPGAERLSDALPGARLQAGRPRGCADCPGRAARPARRPADGHKRRDQHAGRAHHLRFAHLGELHPPLRRDRGRAPGARRRHPSRKDELR